MNSVDLQLNKAEFKLFVDYLETVVETLQAEQRELIQSDAPLNDIQDVSSLVRAFTNKGRELRPLINNYNGSGASQEGNILRFTADQLMRLGAEFVKISNELSTSPFSNLRQDGQALHTLANKIIDVIPFDTNNNAPAPVPVHRVNPTPRNTTTGPEARRRRNRRATRKNRKSRKNRKASRRA
jgi:hypothetical protein